MKLNNIFTQIPEYLDQEIVDVLQNSETLKIERIVSSGQRSPKTGWYDQTENEWVIVLSGEATLQFENKEVKMTQGSYLNIPAHTKHRVSWTHPTEKTVWLAIFY